MNMRHLIAIATLIAAGTVAIPCLQNFGRRIGSILCGHFDMRAESSRLFEICGLREATAIGTMALGQGPYI